MWEAAGFLGMSEMTLRETYGITTRPTLRTAANAIGTHSAPSKNVGLVVSLVDERRGANGRAKPSLKILVGPAEVPPFNEINHLILSRRHNGPQMDQRFLTECLAMSRLCAGAARPVAGPCALGALCGLPAALA
ncbi:hypothetical protein [Bradyrhizobium ottawaense]|uniref:hypothetical protein n=1 Tax=Bradyrhizobium ottawaense TaxID=931866 RepID=UPI0030F478B9